MLACGAVAAVTYLWFRWRYANKEDPDMKLIASVNPEYVPMGYRSDAYEKQRENVILQVELGQGSFGMVI